MKLGLVLAGPLEPPLPSTRVALLNVLPMLHAQGIRSVVLHAPQHATETPLLTLDPGDICAQGVQVVIFQKVYGPSAEALALALEAKGVRTVFMVCDRVVPEMAAATSATVCVTQYLASLYPARLAPKMHVVHDGIERPEVQKTHWRQDRGSELRPLRAVLVTSARLDYLPVLRQVPAWLHVAIVGQYPEQHDRIGRLREHWRSWLRKPQHRLRQIGMALHPRISVHAWHAEGVYEQLVKADLGIVPIDAAPQLRADQPPPPWYVKSENRLTLKMSVGLPVIATPIPAYHSAVVQGKTAYLASTHEEWLAALGRLRDPEHRIAMGQAARLAASESYSMQRQADLLRAVLQPVK